jgi:phosphate transport system permease protein
MSEVIPVDQCLERAGRAVRRAVSAIYGTVVTSVIALFIAVPVSFGIALFLTETCPVWLRRPLGTAIELLAGVPSIIYGIWGLFVFAPLFARHVQPHLQTLFGDLPVIGGWFAGPPIGVGILDRRHRVVADGDSLRGLGDA